MGVSGKNIWLIGASEGIGAALAGKLVQAGAKVAISARNTVRLGELASTFPEDSFLTIPLDVTDLASVEAAWNALMQKWSGIDMVIYNAGSYEPMDAQHFDLSHVERMVDVNLHGIFRMLALVLPYFIKRNTGHIALVGSVAGYRGLPSAIGYGASKAAVIHLAENLKADLADTNIKVQIINPGFVDTRLTQKNDFSMPSMITPDAAANHIIEGLQSSSFEIHFPKRFTYILKTLALLPASLYFWSLKHINK